MKTPAFVKKTSDKVTGFIDKHYDNWLKPQVVVLVLGIFFGLMFTFLTPPLMVNDEQAHFWRAYKLSEGDLIPSEKQGEIVGEYMPKSIINLFEVYYRLGTRERPVDDFNLSDGAYYIKQPLNANDKGFIGMMNTISYTPIPYIPQTLGVFIGRVANFSPFGILLMGRIANLLFTMLCIYFAVKITPVLKWAFVLLALMPTMLGQVSSVSADGMTISMAFIFIALVFRAGFDKNFAISRKWLIATAVSGVLLSVSKQAYIVLPFLIFLIPWKKFGSFWKYAVFTGVFIFFAITPSLAWNINVSPAAYTAGEQVLIDQNKEFIKDNPVHSVGVVFYDIYLRNSENYVETLVGRLGWMQIPMSFIFHVLPYLFAILLIALLEKNDEIRVTLLSKLWVLMLASANIFLVGFALYTLWTKGSHNVVEGLQGRYYAPLIPLLLICLWNKSFFFKPNFKYPKLYLVGFLCLSSVVALFHMFVFFYLNTKIIS